MQKWHLPVRLKFWLYQLYWLLMVVAIGGVASLVFWDRLETKESLTTAGAVLSFLYFVHKQRLEEMKLFREIFADCNRRYDEMNEHLQILASKKSEDPADPQDRERIVDYFNLCAEEYLYYRKGYIYPEVWSAWANGMKYYSRKPLFEEVWERERGTDSYYGLEFD